MNPSNLEMEKDSTQLLKERLLKTPQVILLTCLSAIAAGCNGTSPTPQEQASTSSAEPATNDGAATDSANSGQSYQVEKVIAVPVSGQNEAFFLGRGGVIQYQLPIMATGMLTGMAIQVGNFGGTSEGTIVMRACQASNCSEGIAQLAGSVDNEYLPARFRTPLSVSEGELDLTVIRDTGENPFAVWTYPAEKEMVLPDGVKVAKTLNTEFYVKTN